MSKIANKTKTKWTVLNWQQIPKLKNITILIKFKIRISQLISIILFKQQSLNQIRHGLRGHNQI